MGGRFPGSSQPAERWRTGDTGLKKGKTVSHIESKTIKGDKVTCKGRGSGYCGRTFDIKAAGLVWIDENSIPRKVIMPEHNHKETGQRCPKSGKPMPSHN